MAPSRYYSNTAVKTTLASSIGTGDSQIQLSSYTGMPVNYPFTLIIEKDTANEEIVTVISKVGAIYNITRGGTGGDGTTARAHTAGVAVEHGVSARDFADSRAHEDASSGVHGATGSIVGTTDTQTLSNKTLTTPTIASFANANHNHINGAGGGTLTSAAITDFTEAAQDAVGTAITGGTQSGIAVTYDDAGGVYNFNVNDPVISIDGDIAGSATMTNLGNVTINTGITAGVIVNADISGSAAIAASKIAGTAVTQADTGTVTSTMIANGTIVDADINASAAIDKTKISGTAITAADTGTVTSTMIADGTIVNADISATAAIAKTKLDLSGTITSADIVDGTIVNADISNSASIALSKLATDPLARANHTGTQTASTISDFDTQVRTSRLDQMAAPTANVSANNYKVTNLANPTNNGDAVSLGYLNSQKGVANGIAELDGDGKVPTHHLPALAIAETFVVASQAAMLALTAQTGDIAVRTDVNKSFILTTSPASTLGNWQELLTPTDSVLSVDGNTGAVSLSGTYVNRTTGQLLGNLDANSHKVTNLGTPTSSADAATKAYVDTVAGSATAAAASAAAAEAAYDSFDDRYLGAKTSDPTLDNDGNALLTGALYWNSVASEMRAYDGSAWKQLAPQASFFRWKFTAAGGETSLSGLDDNGITLAYNVGAAYVYLNGVLLVKGSDYTATTGSSITSLSALTAGDVVEVISLPALVIADAILQTVFDAKGDILVASAADTTGKLSVGSDGQILVADSSQATGVKWSNAINVNSSSDAFRITQTGTGNAFVVEDSANPDSTPFVVNASGNVGIGTASSLNQLLTVAGDMELRNNNVTQPTIHFTSQDGTTNVWQIDAQVSNAVNAQLQFINNGTERMRITSAGNVGIGTNAPAGLLHTYHATNNQTIFTGDSTVNVIARRGSTDTTGPQFVMDKARGTNASPTVLSNGDVTGSIFFRGYDGSNYVTSAEIRGQIDGATGTNDMPGRLVFLTSTDGTATPTERVRIDNTGRVKLNAGSATFEAPLALNTQTASYTLALTDAGQHVEMNVATANNLTVPPNSTVAFPIGTQILVSQYGAGQTTFVAGAGVTIRSNGAKLKLTGQYAQATLVKRGTDEWYVSGNLSA